MAEWIPRDGGEFEITAVNYVLYPDSGTDQDTGEHREFTRVCFIDRQGRMAKFSSDFGPSAMRRIAMLFTPEEWRRGIVIRCAAKQSKRSGRVYGEFRVVRVVEDSK